jgi:oligopeptide/dipeptide ABC transporter ATP-binding protein
MVNITEEPILETENLTRYFDIGGKQIVHAVDGVSISVSEKEILGLVGESGSGKSTFGKVVLGLHPKTKGTVKFRGQVLPRKYNSADFQKWSQKMQMIFQDPYSSLNPRMTVGEIIGEGLRLQTNLKNNQIKEKVSDWLIRVGLQSDHMSRYPHEFSGGQRQRIGIARALILEPDFVVCDEPISALDVSVQAQVINLLGDLKETMGLTLIFIAHDLSMVRYVSDRMAVMYLGSIVEVGKADQVYFDPKHPYTNILVGSNPEPDPREERKRPSTAIRGEIPSPVNVAPGCRFANRCPNVEEICNRVTPNLLPLKDVERQVACHLFN